MADIIPFRSKGQLIQDRLNKQREQHEFEEHLYKQERIYDRLYNDKNGLNRSKSLDLEQNKFIIQYLTEQEIQTLQEFGAPLDKESNK